MSSSSSSADWYPCGLLSGTPTHPYAVVVLNQPINRHALDAVIDAAAVLVCADAGADRLYRYDHDDGNGDGSEGDSVADPATDDAANPKPKQKQKRRRKNGFRRRLPDAIVGDLDSLTSEVEAHYRARGVTIVKDPDQYSTDFTKCLKWIRDWAVSGTNQYGSHQHQHNAALDVVVLGGLGGRVDQGFSQIHHLFLAENDGGLLQGRIYLLSEQSLSFVLANGHNSIHIEPGYFEENVGVIPVLGRALLTTKGLEWDVEDWPTEFGGQVSTSNHIRSPKIEIAFEGPRPLFTMELDKRLTAAGE